MNIVEPLVALLPNHAQIAHVVDLAEHPGERFQEVKPARVRLNRQDVRASPLEQVAVRFAGRRTLT